MLYNIKLMISVENSLFNDVIKGLHYYHYVHKVTEMWEFKR